MFEIPEWFIKLLYFLTGVGIISLLGGFIYTLYLAFSLLF